MRTSESPDRAAGDVDETPRTGRRHLRRRHERRADAQAAVEHDAAPVVDDRPTTPIEAAEQDVARRKELLLNALRSSHGARAATETLRSEAAEAKAAVQQLDDEETAL